jgi:hypothetical protein
MKKIAFIATAGAIAGAIAVSTPAHACTDWKAIAAMDAAVISHGDRMVVEILKGVPSSGENIAAINEVDRDVAETRRHIQSALDDKCGKE